MFDRFFQSSFFRNRNIFFLIGRVACTMVSMSMRLPWKKQLAGNITTRWATNSPNPSIILKVLQVQLTLWEVATSNSRWCSNSNTCRQVGDLDLVQIMARMVLAVWYIITFRPRINRGARFHQPTSLPNFKQAEISYCRTRSTIHIRLRRKVRKPKCWLELMELQSEVTVLSRW